MVRLIILQSDQTFDLYVQLYETIRKLNRQIGQANIKFKKFSFQYSISSLLTILCTL